MMRYHWVLCWRCKGKGWTYVGSSTVLTAPCQSCLGYGGWGDPAIEPLPAAASLCPADRWLAKIEKALWTPEESSKDSIKTAVNRYRQIPAEVGCASRWPGAVSERIRSDNPLGGMGY